MEKGKKIKKWLPLLCATLLLLGSCMTVCATSMPMPDDDRYCYCVKTTKIGSTTPYRVYYMRTKSVYIDDFVATSSDVYYSEYVDGVWGNLKHFTPSSYAGITISGDTEILYSNHDILYLNSDEIFFQQPPFPIAEMAIPLTAEIQKQTGIILPIAVGCLALVIGSIMLLPRLRNFLAR